MKTVKKVFFLLFLFMSFCTCNAQESKRPYYRVNWKQIDSIANENPDSIRGLVKRLTQQTMDTTMTNEERILAYYGSTYLPEHKGVLYDLRKILFNMRDREYEDALKRNIEVLKRAPLDLNALENMVMLIRVEQNSSSKHKTYTDDDLRYYSNLMDVVVKIVASTGLGSEEAPFAVTSIRDEYILMYYYLEIKYGNQGFNVHDGYSVDYFGVKEKSDKYSGDIIVFDTSRVLELENEDFLQKKAKKKKNKKIPATN